MTNNTPKLPRSEQSRINGAKSKGPTSPEGKARSSANSTKHGFAAAVNNVIVVEDKEAFDRHVVGYRAALTPQNYLEDTLVDQLASINWRQTRLVGLETALLDVQLSFQKDVFLETQPEGAHDPYFRLVFAWEALSRKSQVPEDANRLPETFDVHCLELVRRYITTLDRQYRNTMLNLRQYRKDFAPPQLLPEQNEPENLPPAAPVATPEAVETPKIQISKSVIRPISPIGPEFVGSKAVTTTENPTGRVPVEKKDRS